MNNIIDYLAYKWRSDVMNERFQKLISELEKKGKEKYVFSMTEIDDIAENILFNSDYYLCDSATPIVKIVKQFGFKAYREQIKDNNLSGDISINGDTYDVYGHDKVIIVNEMDEIYHQRFVTAHELAHYLFDFLGNSQYDDKSQKFTAAYYKDNHNTADEKRANRFAASILMPKDIFIKQYNIAKAADGSNLFISMYLSRFLKHLLALLKEE